MNQLLSNIQSYIHTHKLFDLNDRLLLTVSGGIDSICMIHILQKLCYNITVAHCNFGLRAKASDDDEKFVRETCENLGIPFHHKKFDTSTFAKENQVSTQMAARELRYTWFFELLEKENLDYILTAHHANDQVETILFNLTKGTSISGIRGIAQKEKIKRPLLKINKEDIKKYADINDLNWREDQSNSSNKYHRNSIRNEVIPILKKINPSIEKTFSTNVDRFISLEKLLKKQVTDVKNQYLTKDKDFYKLSLAWFSVSNGGTIVLDEILKEYGFNFDQTKSIVACLTNDSGKKFLSKSYEVIVDRSQLYINHTSVVDKEVITVDQDTTQISTAYSTITFEQTTAPVEILKENNMAYLDADLVKYPLNIRNWKSGDYFIPLGMSGKKKLSDFMIDHKIPVNLKGRLLVFESQKDIIWVEGMRIDNRFKITAKTKNVLIIKSTPNV